MIRVALPYHLRNLAKVGSEVQLLVPGEVTLQSILDVIEESYPMLAGTIRDRVTKTDVDHFLGFMLVALIFRSPPPDTQLPDKVITGEEPFLVVGAIAGG